MGMHDRDWYRDLLRKRQGLRPKYQTWKWLPKKDGKHQLVLNTQDGEDDGGAYLRQSQHVSKPSEPWHPVLQIMLFVVICLGMFLLLRLFKY